MKTMTREETIEALRRALLDLTDDEHCICAVASKLHVFCGGFSQWKSHELRERYDWIVKRNSRITRAELEELANRWQLARQFVRDTPLACDTQTIEHHTCGGWDDFTDEKLAEHLTELTGEEVRVLPRAPAATEASSGPRNEG
jgi:hypothetical protein